MSRMWSEITAHKRRCPVPVVVGANVKCKEERMVDFNKFNDPLEREKRRKARLELEQQMEARAKAHRFMAVKLYEMVEHDKISDDYDKRFITNVHARIGAGLPLSDKQEAYLEKCFHEKY